MSPVESLYWYPTALALQIVLVYAFYRYARTGTRLAGGDSSADTDDPGDGVDREAGVVHCPDCGTENERGYAYCRNCVGELPDAAAWRSSEFAPRQRRIP
ncbi:zinc ribbon domain-containing protein [Halobiforma lacisalsi AJ5]|uniref:Zinc ribbon domain-containing protein n=1 Tax=Natronobacterium lacisalsi AJ5 TaxID=358396 RepID=M0LHB9_NATLA|nr:zinc ribbon domain-containing protein [Halobiforma lacisalsi]APW96396.1 zinc ribbon domain-containing protein [Halobiforma lacisalsi AJ5]EMA31834.1 hypothetical protein C445_13505 [Halobiforma lacisalsi AJ5]